MNNNHLQLDFENDFIYLEYTYQYPKDGKHLTLHTTLPCTISKGNDTFYFTDKNGIDHESKQHLWYVHFPNHPITMKAFITPKNAYTYATKQYTQWLSDEINRIHNTIN